jgi:hypothetical protein
MRLAANRNALYTRTIASEPFTPVAHTGICEHVVQEYRDSPELAASVADFLAVGFTAGEPAVVVATAAHWPEIASTLKADRWDAEELLADDRLFLADADETLDAMYENGALSRGRFTAVIGSLLDRADAAAPSRRTRVFGEMVDILCRRGDPDAADVLEGFWNELGAERPFLLFCGYKIDIFDLDAQSRLLPQVYKSHSHVVPAGDAQAIEAALAAALTEALGEARVDKLYARVAQTGADVHVPAAQRAIMWLSAHMPRTAEQVLATSRDRYLSQQSASA